jgi:hypothetical protein
MLLVLLLVVREVGVTAVVVIVVVMEEAVGEGVVATVVVEEDVVGFENTSADTTAPRTTLNTPIWRPRPRFPRFDYDCILNRTERIHRYDH